MRARLGWIVVLALTVALGACTKKKTEAEPKKAQLKQMALPATKELPEEVVFYEVIANPTRLLGELEKLGAKVSPVPPGTLHAMVTSMLIQAGFKDTSVLDLKAPLGIMLLDPKRYPEPALLAMQVQGEDQVLKSLQPAWKHKGAKQGVHELIQEQVDTYGVFKGDSAKPPPKVSRSLFVRFNNKIMLLATSREALEKGGPLLQKQLAAAPRQGVVGALLVNHLRKSFQAELQAAPGIFAKSIKPEIISSGMQDPEKMAWLLDWMFAKMLALVNQTREVSFSATVTEEGALATFGLAPEPGSFFAKFLAAQKHVPLKLTGALPQGHFLAVAFNLQWRMFKDDLIEFTREIMKMFFSKELDEEFLAAIIEMWEVMGDEIALTENLDADGFSIVEVFTVTDDKRAQAAITKLLGLTSKLLSGNDALMGMKFKFSGPKDIGEHDGVKMQSLAMDWDLKSLPPEQAEIIKHFYGDRMNMVMAIFDGKFALTMGKQAKPEMRKLIDRVRKKQPGLTSSPSFISAAGDLVKDSGGFFYMSIVTMIATSLESTYAAMGQKPPDFKLPPSGSGMFLGFKSTPERVDMTLRVPGQHLAEIGQVIKAMMQAAGGQGH